MREGGRKAFCCLLGNQKHPARRTIYCTFLSFFFFFFGIYARKSVKGNLNPEAIMPRVDPKCARARNIEIKIVSLEFKW